MPSTPEEEIISVVGVNVADQGLVGVIRAGLKAHLAAFPATRLTCMLFLVFRPSSYL